MKQLLFIVYSLCALVGHAETKWDKIQLNNPSELELILQNYDSILAVVYYHPERDPDEELATDYEIHFFHFEGKDYLYVTGAIGYIPLWMVEDEKTGQYIVSPSIIGHCDRESYKFVLYLHMKKRSKQVRKILKSIDYSTDLDEIIKKNKKDVIYDPLQAVYELRRDGTFTLVEYGHTLKFWKGKKYER